MRQAIASPGAPAAIGPYSAAVRSEPAVPVRVDSLDPATDRWCGDIAAQTTRAMDNIAALPTPPARFSHVVKTTVFLADMNEFAAMNEVYARY